MDVFRVGAFGRPASSPVVTVVPGAVPFAVTFRPGAVIAVAEAGTNAVDTFAIHPNGTLAALHSAPTGQAATCWIVGHGTLLYASNAGSATLTGLRAGPAGSLTVLGQTSTDPGTVDAAVTPDGRYLYVQAGGTGTVDEFRVHADGTLTRSAQSWSPPRSAPKESSPPDHWNDHCPGRRRRPRQWRRTPWLRPVQIPSSDDKLVDQADTSLSLVAHRRAVL